MSSLIKGLTPGEKIYKYELLCPIGSGGFGAVWKAHDHSVNNEIAVKILDSNTHSLLDSLTEAQIGHHIEHPNLVKVHYADIVNHNGTPIVVIAMDYLPKGSICSLQNSLNFLPIHSVIKISIDLLRGLEYLHCKNIFHNDLKPQNILLGENCQGIITDYGITCKSFGNSSVTPRSVYLPHMSPEYITSQQINHLTDIYQTGLTLFRLLNGIDFLPNKFVSMGSQVYESEILNGRIITNGDYQCFIPRQLKTIINKAIHPNPQNRFQTALEMRRALETLAFPGYWSCDGKGDYLGFDSNYTYRFQIIPKRKKSFDFEALKKHNTSGRETKLSQFCVKNISKAIVDQTKSKFMKYVVAG